MKVADVQRNQDSGTTVIEVDQWPDTGFPPGCHVQIGDAVYLIVNQFPLLNQIEVARG